MSEWFHFAGSLEWHFGWNAIGYAIGFIGGGFIEWFVHRFLMHRRVGVIEYAYTTHTLDHHVKFGFDETYVAITPEMEADHGAFCWKEYTLLPLLAFMLYAPIHVLTGKPILAGAMLASMTGLLLYDYLHYNFHVLKDSWVQRNRYFLFLKEHHRGHHEDMKTNFNVYFLPIADLLLGTYKRGSSDGRPAGI